MGPMLEQGDLLAQHLRSRLLERVYLASNEGELQDAIASVLAKEAGGREVILDDGRGRPDFFFRLSEGDFGIAVEVKRPTKSSRWSLPEVLDQVYRYSMAPQVLAVLLVSTAQTMARLNGQRLAGGKLLRVAVLQT